MTQIGHGNIPAIRTHLAQLLERLCRLDPVVRVTLLRHCRVRLNGVKVLDESKQNSRCEARPC